MKQQNVYSFQVQTTFSDDVHTPDNPYCNDLSCSCHTDVEYHDQVTSFSDDIDESAYSCALAFLSLEED